MNSEKLFKRESDNHFEDPSLLSQPAAQSITSVVTDLVSIRKRQSAKQEKNLEQNHINRLMNSMVDEVVNWGSSAARPSVKSPKINLLL